MKKDAFVSVVASILLGGFTHLAVAQDGNAEKEDQAANGNVQVAESAKADTKDLSNAVPGVGYEKVGKVRIKGQDIYLSQGVVDIVDEEGQANLTGSDKRIKCQRTVRTGSHIVMRVCKTVAEWEAQRQANQSQMYDLYNQSKRACAEGFSGTGGGRLGFRISDSVGC
ncbi:MAG: hypothetical protein MJA83_04630 [Gammaproteobacteria bacterium]|nr:hypothetical protein [Gammaproteobacteria bacterium]